jgi:hypothetical protein
MQAAQIAGNMLLQPSLRPLGGNLRVSGVRCRPHHVAAVRQSWPLSEDNGDNRAKT